MNRQDLIQKVQSLLRFVPDKSYLGMYYFAKFKRRLNLKNPQTYNEKLQWLKLYDRKPIYTTMVDKYEVKKYVADKIGEEYIIPTLGVWDDFEQIDFNELPNQFVLKCTHDSGGLVICKDKTTLNIEEARKTINKSLKSKYFYKAREWPYKNVKPRIIAEKYMVDTDNDEKHKDNLTDYKFFCFNGKPQMYFIEKNRWLGRKGHTVDFFDMEGNLLDLQVDGYPNSEGEHNKPQSFEKMVELAEVLSNNVPHLRVDFYNVDGKIYFGELTFYQNGGFITFQPEYYNYKLGDWIILDSSSCK